jgi:hypothetical protein
LVERGANVNVRALKETTPLMYAAFEGHSEIGDSAFRGCTSLASITIPESVTQIGGYAFQGCTSLDDRAHSSQRRGTRQRGQ